MVHDHFLDDRLRRVERRTAPSVDLHRRLTQTVEDAQAFRRFTHWMLGVLFMWAVVITALVIVML